MKPSVIVKIVAVVIVVGIIIWAVQHRKQRGIELTEEYEASRTSTASLVGAGAVTVDGDRADWSQIAPFSLVQRVGEKNEWASVAVAHDRANLYLLLTAPYVIEERMPSARGTMILGTIYVDADNNLTTGEPLGAQGAVPGCEMAVWLVAKAGAGESPCIGYFFDQYEPGAGDLDSTTQEGKGQFKKIEGSDRDGCTTPQTAAAHRLNMELCIPLADLGIRPTCKTRFIFVASGGTEAPELTVDMP